MSLTPPSLENALPLGSRLYYISRARVVACKVAEVSHHFARIVSAAPAKVRPPRPGLQQGQLFDGGAIASPPPLRLPGRYWIDTRELPLLFYRNAHEADLACAFAHKRGGSIARNLLHLAERAGGELGPYRVAAVRGCLSGTHTNGEVSRALRILAALGHAERVQVGKQKLWVTRHRWTEPAPPAPPQPGVPGDLPGDAGP